MEKGAVNFRWPEMINFQWRFTLSLAPLKGSADLNLLDFLGVDLQEKARDYIIEGDDPSEAPVRSLFNALRVYGEVVRAVEGEHFSSNRGEHRAAD